MAIEKEEKKMNLGTRSALFSTSAINLKKHLNGMGVKFVIKNPPKEIDDDVEFGYIGFCQLKPKSKELSDRQISLWHLTHQEFKLYSTIEVIIQHCNGLIHICINGKMNLEKSFVYDATQSFGFFVSFLEKDYNLNCRIQILKQNNVDFRSVSRQKI